MTMTPHRGASHRPRSTHTEPIREHPPHTSDAPQSRTPVTPIDRSRTEPVPRRQ